MDETPDRFVFHIVDDDQDFVDLVRDVLQAEGHQVRATTASREAVREIRLAPPDCVLLDLMMPEVDGLEVCRQLRALPELSKTPIVFVSGKAYSFDREQARRAGGNGYLVKPIVPASFIAEIERIVLQRVTIRFWGVRGTVPVPGRRTVRYGGNTPCVSLEKSDGDMFVFDAGTGIRELSSHLQRADRHRVRATIFISHPHWDHINALPYFAPFYAQGNAFDIYAPADDDSAVTEMIFAQMDSIYFPVTSREFAASVRCYNLGPGRREIGGVDVQTMMLSHPGQCLGYRLNFGGKALCYVTDNELFPPGSPHYNLHYRKQLREFVAGSRVLIADATYFPEEYTRHVGWGHSSVDQVVRLAHEANVEHLCLFHHDPDQSDDDIDRKVELAQELSKEMDSPLICSAPAEGDTLVM